MLDASCWYNGINQTFGLMQQGPGSTHPDWSWVPPRTGGCQPCFAGRTYCCSGWKTRGSVQTVPPCSALRPSLRCHGWQTGTQALRIQPAGGRNIGTEGHTEEWGDGKGRKRWRQEERVGRRREGGGGGRRGGGGERAGRGGEGNVGWLCRKRFWKWLV